ncbi:CRISPR locus-related DNA-binding protein, partial [Sulfolobus sp. B5]
MDGKNKALVFTMGFTIENLVKAITSKGVRGDEQVVLLSALTTDEFGKKRSEEALRFAIDYISKVGLKYFIKYINVNTPFETILSQIHEVLRGFDEVEIYIIGGMRILGIASYYYSILISPFKKIKAVCFTENMENSYELLTYVPRAPEGKEIIELMSELKEPREIKEIASNLNKTVSTVSKQLSKISDLVDCV